MNICKSCTKANRSCPVYTPGYVRQKCIHYNEEIEMPTGNGVGPGEGPIPVVTVIDEMEIVRRVDKVAKEPYKGVNAVPDPEFDIVADPVQATLDERGAKYGNAVDQFSLAQMIKGAMRGSIANDDGEIYIQGNIEDCWNNLPPVARESLDMIIHKMSRIICGKYDHADSWHDIAGYAKLAEEKVCKNGDS